MSLRLLERMLSKRGRSGPSSEKVPQLSRMSQHRSDRRSPDVPTFVAGIHAVGKDLKAIFV
jgi:hypothetical protein